MRRKLLVGCLVAILMLGVPLVAEAATPPSATLLSDPLVSTTEAVTVKPLRVSWVQGMALPGTVLVGQEFKIGVSLENTSTTSTFNKVLVVVEVLKNGVDATQADFEAKCVKDTANAGISDATPVSIGYDAGGFWFWGDRTNGFTVGPSYKHESHFVVKINSAGTYTVKIYAVQLQ